MDRKFYVAFRRCQFDAEQHSAIFVHVTVSLDTRYRIYYAREDLSHRSIVKNIIFTKITPL